MTDKEMAQSDITLAIFRVKQLYKQRKLADTIRNSKNYKNIVYTFLHRQAFKEVELRLLGKNTERSNVHDMDKMCLFLVTSKSESGEIHRKVAEHHNKRATNKDVLIETAIDWECARFTKPDKPLNARETMLKYYNTPSMINRMTPILVELGINKEGAYLCEPCTEETFNYMLSTVSIEDLVNEYYQYIKLTEPSLINIIQY